MKTILIILIVCISFNIEAQVDEPKAATQSKTSSTSNYFNDDPFFRINFKSQPTKTANDIETAVGTVKMVTYMVEEPTVAYMIAYSTYPSNHITANNTQTMLDNAVGGFIGNLQMTLIDQKEISLQGNKGVLFKASSDLYYAIVADYLVNNTLFQIGIMRSDGFPTQNEVNDFIYTFELK